jgi:polysaccharide biosynthesis transport protein
MNSNPEPIQPQEVTIREYFDMVLRHRWLVLICFLVVFAVTTIISMTRPYEYMASSTFTIEMQNSYGMSFGNLQNTGLGRPGRSMQFYQAVLNSSSFRRRVIEFAQQDSILNLIPEFHKDEVGPYLSRLDLGIFEDSDLSSITLIANHPIIAYRLATIATDMYKDQCKEIEEEESRNVVDFVEKQKAVAWAKLEETEKALHEFKQKASIVTSENGVDVSVLRKLTELEAELTDIQTKRELAEATIRTFDTRLQELKGVESSPEEAVESPTVKALRKEMEMLSQQHQKAINDYGPNSTQVAEMEKKIKDKRDEFIKAIMNEERPEGVSSSYDQSLWQQIQQNKVQEVLGLDLLRNRERYYQQLIARLRAQDPQMLESAIESSRLERQKQVSENLYLFLAEKGEEANIKSATGTGGVQIIDYPTIPRNPMPRRVTRNLFLGAIIGFALGIGLALLIEYLDTSIRTAHDVDRYLHLAYMGSIPHMDDGAFKSSQKIAKKLAKAMNTGPDDKDKSDGKLNSHLISALRPRDPVVDNYRSIRTNLQFTAIDQALRSLLVTSSLPGEGKTVTSANLAISFSELGKKVVLVDCDLRKPRQHDLFHIKKNPGLTDYLVRGIPLENVVFQTNVPNLHLIPSGTLPPNPAEMIASQKMSEFFETTRDMFDITIVDSPPMGIVTDSLLLATKVDYVLLIIKQGITSKSVISELNQMLSRTRTRIIGAVLNNVKIGPGYGHYYKYYYHRYYYSDSATKK